MRALIDSDVYLDYILQRAPHHLAVNELFEMLSDEKFEAFVCALSTTTIFYFTRKAKDIDGAYAAVNDVLATANICAVDKKVLSVAATLGFSDYEDGVQCASAMAEGLDAIVTRNTKDYKNSPIPVYSPSAFLSVV